MGRCNCCTTIVAQLDALAGAVLEHETLDEPDAYAAAGLPRRRAVELTAGSTPPPEARDGRPAQHERWICVVFTESAQRKHRAFTPPHDTGVREDDMSSR